MKLLKVIFNGAMFIFGIAVMFTIFQLLFTGIESFKKQKTKKGKSFKIRGLKKEFGLGGRSFKFSQTGGELVLKQTNKENKKGKKPFLWTLSDDALNYLKISEKGLKKLGLKENQKTDIESKFIY